MTSYPRRFALSLSLLPLIFSLGSTACSSQPERAASAGEPPPAATGREAGSDERPSAGAGAGASDAGSRTVGDAGDAGCGDAATLASDEHNCGRCGHDCLGGACVAGQCQALQLASGEGEIDGLAIAPTHIYWTSYHRQHVVRCALPTCAGGAEVIAQTAGPATGIGVNASHVFWSDWGAGGATGTIAKCVPGNCEATRTVMVTGLTRPNGLSLTNTDVFWDSSYAGVLGRCSLGCAGAAGTTVAGSQYSTNHSFIAAGSLYWMISSSASSGAIRYCPLTGCNPDSPPSLVEGIGQPVGLTANSTHVYWNSRLTQQILSCDLPACAGGPQEVVSGQGLVAYMAADDERLYWSTAAIGASTTLWSCRLPACTTPEPAANLGLEALGHIKISGHRVYYTTSEGKVFVLAKP